MIQAFTLAVALLAASTSLAGSALQDVSPSQPSAAAFAASLQSCPASAAEVTEQPHASLSCVYLAPNSITALQPGPPATLPFHTTLLGAPSSGALPASCCGHSNSTPHLPLPPQRINATTNSTNTSLHEVELSRLASSSLVVPSNGTLSLHNLALTAAQLPTAPYPLPTTSFLSLLAIRLSPGARLKLSSVTITTPSCVSLALHQDLACRAAPTPNFTVTPTSLLVHSYTTASLSVNNVLLTCSGRQSPAPCAAAVVRSGVELLREAWAWEWKRDSPPASLYLYVQGAIQLRRPNAEDGSGNSSSSKTGGGDGNALDLDVWAEMQKLVPGSTSLPITRGTLVLGGPPNRSSVLDVSFTSKLFSIQDAGLVRLQHLTLRGLPLGPPERYPEALLRLPMWFAPALQPMAGLQRDALLVVSNITMELPPEEMAFWRDVRHGRTQRLVEQTSPGSAGTEACITDSGYLFFTQWLAAAPGCSSCVLAQRLIITGGMLQIYDTLLVDASEAAVPSLPPLPPPQQQQVGGQEQQLQAGSTAPGNQQDQQQLQQLPSGPWLPPIPSTPLCALAPGPGAREAMALGQVITDYYTEVVFRGSSGRLPSASSPAPAAKFWRQEQLPPAFLDNFISRGRFLRPGDLSHTLQPLSFNKYGTILDEDTAADTLNGFIDDKNFLREQAVVQLPGTLLLGDPVGVRTLDLAGLPSAVVLEREPLARASSMWVAPDVFPDVLLPFLETVRQERHAAGLRGLLTEPVSLTVRHLVLINLPAAGPFVRILPPPRPPDFPVFARRELLEEDPESTVLAESPNAVGALDVRVAGRGLRQVLPSSGEGADATGGTGASGASEAATPDADYLGGLPPSLANLTSCVWSLQLDRAAVVRAVRARLQQGAPGGGSGSGNSSSSGGGVQSPVDVSYVLLQSVQLVVPERELLLLAWAWATNATRHAAHPGLAEQLQLMLDGSRLAGGTGTGQQPLQNPPSGIGSPDPTLPVGLRLVFDQFVWCGLLGTNVTLTSQLPGPTPLSLQLPDLDLPVAYGTGPDGPHQAEPAAGPEAVGWVPPPPLVVVGPPSPGAGAGDQAGGGPSAPAAAERPGGQGPTRVVAGPSVPPVQGPGGVQLPGAANGGSGGGGSSTPPVPLGLAVGLAVGCAAVLVGACGVAVLVVRRKRATRGRDKWGQGPSNLVMGCGAGAGGFAAPEDEARVNEGRSKVEQQQQQQVDVGNEADVVALGKGAQANDESSIESVEGQGSPHVLAHQQQSVVQEPSLSPRASPWLLQQMTELRMNIEGKRQAVLSQAQEPQPEKKRPQQQEQQQEEEPSQQQRRQQQEQEVLRRGAGGYVGESGPLVAATQGPTPTQQQQQQRVADGGVQLGSGQDGTSSSAIAGDPWHGGSSANSMPSAVLEMGTQDMADGNLSLDLAAASSSGLEFGSAAVAAAAAAAAAIGIARAHMAVAKATAGSHVSRAAGGGGDSSNSGKSSSGGSSGHPLVLLRELGRGAQGVVYAGRWRGLDVAVKSVLVQRLGGSPTGATWHGPSLHSALAEGSISSAMSHPHVVATYATYVQGPEGEGELGQEQETEKGPPEGGGAGGPGTPAPGKAAVGATVGLQGIHEPVHRSATAEAALEVLMSEVAAELRRKVEVGEGVGSEEVGAATVVGSSSSIACGDVNTAEQQVPYVGQGSAGMFRQHGCTEQSEPVIPTSTALRHSKSAQLPTPGAAGAQVQVWKLTLVQELCTGGSLRDSLLAGRLARRGGGPWPRALHPAAALRLALHVARGSAHLHRHGVLWNDLSSANVLLQLGRRGGAAEEAAGTDSTGSSGVLDFVAKVADFGLSRRLPEGATHASETAGRSGLYVAPEVVRYGRCTPASDVYAYGVLLWEVAAGVPMPELLSQPEGGAVRSWLAQQAFVAPEEAEALPAQLLVWPGAEQQRQGGEGLAGASDGVEDTAISGDGAGLLPAGYVALAEQCLRQDPQQRPSFEGACLRLERIHRGMGGT